MYKILLGQYDIAVTPRVNPEYSCITRVNDIKLQKCRNMYMPCTTLLPGHSLLLFTLPLYLA